MLNIEKTTYGNRREARSEFVAQRFARYFDKKSVLDVGCFEAPLRRILQTSAYTGIDFAGDPDIKVNLQESPCLPFNDQEFDNVICIDVLEHLDNLHSIFFELIRVSRRHVIISLPNCWRDARLKIARGKGDFAHYGLPPQPPADRHRWFFNITQAHHFFRENSQVAGVEIKECFVTEETGKPVISLLRHLRYPGERYLNRYAQTIWVVLEKRDA
ncbi:MAG: hypothetical protein CSA79_06105 [Thiothrix nivea]|nr:MAG: hypothetical protein CSA79_06105 [Thiothrix nivea]